MSSRIIVKGLPKKYKESRLKELFSQHGDITQIKYFPDRRFAYIGYANEEIAQKAATHHDGTFIDTSRIQVVLALGIGDQRLPRPWSKYSSGSSAHETLKKKRDQILSSCSNTDRKSEKSAQENEKQEAEVSRTLTSLEKKKQLLKELYNVEANPELNPELAEYMQLMIPKKQRTVWSNDGGILNTKTQASQENTAPTQPGSNKVKAVLKSVPSRRPGGEGVTHLQQHLKFEDSDDGTDDEEYLELPDGRNSSTFSGRDVEDCSTIDGNISSESMGALKTDSDTKIYDDQDASADQNLKNSSSDGESGDDHDDNISDSEWLKSKIKQNLESISTNIDTDQYTHLSNAGDNSSSKEKTTISNSLGDFVPEYNDVNIERKGPITLYTVKMRGLPFKAKEAEIFEFLRPVVPVEIRILKDKRRHSKGVAFIDVRSKEDLDTVMKKNQAKMGERYIEIMSTESKQLPALTPQDAENRKVYPDPLTEKDEGMEVTGRLFVRNLAYLCTEDDLRKLFEQYGTLSEVHLPIDTETKQPKGIAFIRYVSPENAVHAFSELDAKGRLLHILPARDREHDLGITNFEENNFKNKKLQELKSKRENSYNWNSLFLRQNAVADSMAHDLQISKGELLNVKSQSGLAVRLALGETRVVEENKRFLKKHGVDLGAFGQQAKTRSKTTILLKNLPFDSAEAELRTMFEKHGSIDKFVFPPSRTMALVSFLEPVEARGAFRSLAYRKYKGEMLYLEWAPEQVFDGNMNSEDSDSEDDIEDTATQAKTKSAFQEKVRGVGQGEGEIAAELDLSAANTVFVKNLNFETNDDTLYNFFETCGTIRSARVARKKHPKHPDELLSMGFGFVEFKSHTDALKAMKRLQHAELDGHKLELKLSQRTSQQATKSMRKQDIRQLFTPYGDVKSVRLPPKAFDPSQHRGFAFVEFPTKQEAKAAFEALSGSTHLYGRRLNLEFAKDDTSLEKLREQARSVANSSDRSLKRAKLAYDESFVH
eukprot:gene9320-1587_t